MQDSFAVLIDGRHAAALSGAVVEAKVSRKLELPTTFELQVGVDVCDRDYQFIDDEELQPWSGKTVALLASAATRDGTPRWHCLAAGLLTEKKVRYAPGGAGTMLELRGEDHTTLLDRDAENGRQFATVPDLVRSLLEPHFPPGGVRVVAPDLARRSDENLLHVRGNQRTFLSRLAGRCDVRIWVETTCEGTPTAAVVDRIAHFEPVPPRSATGGLPTLVPDAGLEPLDVSGDECRSVDRFETTVTGRRPNRAAPVHTVDPSTGRSVATPVEGPSVPTLGPQDARVGGPRPASLAPDVGVTPDERELAHQAAVNDAAWFVEAEAETTVARYGDVLRPGQQLALQGSGRRNDVTYLVQGIEHRIDAADHTMTLTLVSNAQGG
jgi:hypothetical protein